MIVWGCHRAILDLHGNDFGQCHLYRDNYRKSTLVMWTWLNSSSISETGFLFMHTIYWRLIPCTPPIITDKGWVVGHWHKWGGLTGLMGSYNSFGAPLHTFGISVMFPKMSLKILHKFSENASNSMHNSLFQIVPELFLNFFFKCESQKISSKLIFYLLKGIEWVLPWFENSLFVSKGALFYSFFFFFFFSISPPKAI